MVRVVPSKLTVALLAVVLCLSAGHVSTQFVKYELGHDFQYGLVRLLNMNEENNLSTWFSSSLLLLCGLLLAMIANGMEQRRDRYAGHWAFLAALFMVLSIDESVSMHEMAAIPLRHALDASGYLYYTWVVPAIILLLVLGAFYLRFLLALPRAIRTWFVVSGSIYVTGAVGMEMVCGAAHYAAGTKHTFTYAILTGTEETLEMLGLILFAYALCRHLAAEAPEISFLYGDERIAMPMRSRVVPLPDRHGSAAPASLCGLVEDHGGSLALTLEAQRLK